MTDSSDGSPDPGLNEPCLRWPEQRHVCHPNTVWSHICGIMMPAGIKVSHQLNEEAKGSSTQNDHLSALIIWNKTSLFGTLTVT